MRSSDPPSAGELIDHADELLALEAAIADCVPKGSRPIERPSRVPTDRARGSIELRRFSGPASFVDRMDPIRVAHLTDLHVGRVTPMKVQMAAVERTNLSEPDVVVITGDFVCHSQVYLEALTDVVSRFNAPVYCVLGNHDHWSGADEVRRALKRGGAEVLDNRFTVATLRGQRVQLVGLDDAYTGHAQRDQATKGLDPSLPTLGLSHIAEEAEGLWARGVPFVLSGHTHAGQITLARLHEIAIGRIAGHKYVHGLYGSRREPEGAVYVGAGIGAAVIPLRVGERARREITLFELGLAPGAFDEHHAEQAPLKGRKPTPTLIEKRKAKVLAKRARRERSSVS
jgi:predicted MPP superfamily phosphohydrolase